MTAHGFAPGGGSNTSQRTCGDRPEKLSSSRGTHLSMTLSHVESRRSHTLCGSDGAVRITATRERSRRFSYHSDGRTYTWRRVGKRLSNLVDVTTNVVVLQSSGTHYSGKATSHVVLEDGSQLAFPVRRGRHHLFRMGANRHSLMSAVDATGEHLIEYRWGQFDFR